MAKPAPSQSPPGGSARDTVTPPGADALLGIWKAWTETVSASSRGWSGQDAPWWQLTPGDLTDGLPAGGAQQLSEALAKDPFLRHVDQMWNANPLRDVVPVDWAEVVRALRTVWLRSAGRPEAAIAAT